MKKIVASILVLIVVLYLAKKIANRNGISLGKVPARPPKVRLVYSQKLKPADRPKITESSHAEKVLREVWSSQIEVREEFLVLLMDRRNRVIGYDVVSKGGVNSTLADMKLIFSVALESLASGIIIAHNHPAGSTDPSDQDIRLTRQIKEAGQHLEITLLDHLILTKHDYYSFADNGKL